MSHSTTVTKIETFINTGPLGIPDKWVTMLIKGDMHGFERELSKTLIDLYNLICKESLKAAASQCKDELVKEAKRLGAQKLSMRQILIRVATGKQIKVDNPYIKQTGEAWKGGRHLLGRHWNIIGGVSPMLYDKVGYCAALCPSYDVARQTLSKFGTEISLSSVRDITNRMASKCFEVGEENLLLDKKENLANKNVVISLDGGRTRIRNYTGELNNNKQQRYDTPWCEPKLFVIDVVDEEGQIDRHKLPIYGCRFSDENILKLLERYLVKLKINKAKRVQLVADGAPWIWNNIKPMLQRLKVAPERIIETLDFYHASQYVHQLVQEMPKRIGKKQQNSYLVQFKSWLWKGKSDLIIQECSKIYKRPKALISRWIAYLKKHQSKTQYTDYKQRNLMCGSGIIESGIRRIINLRFKNASTFWRKEIVEKLYLLRAAMLSKRWDILISNLCEGVY
jgi:hypothetical protein